MEALISQPFYAFLFVGLGLVFLFLEVFIPSGGILGLLALGCAAFGVYGLFHQGRPVLGVVTIGGLLAAVVVGIRFGLSRLSFSGSMTPETSTSVDHRIDDAILGKEGVAHSPLRPAGVAIIDGRKVDVVTRGAFLEKGVRVRVVDTSGNRVVVQEIHEKATEGGETA